MMLAVMLKSALGNKIVLKHIAFFFLISQAPVVLNWLKHRFGSLVGNGFVDWHSLCGSILFVLSGGFRI